MAKSYGGSAIIKKIARNDIAKNKTKKIFSIVTIALAAALLMFLAMFESGYETTKDRMAEGQPQAVFYNLSRQQVNSLYSDEHIESIEVKETEKGYDALVTIVDASKMTQYGFTTVVNNVTSKYGIRYAAKNGLFMDSLPDGGLLRQENFVIVGVAVFVIIVSALVIYNIFYLSISNQVQQFGQFRTIGMTQKQVKKVIAFERKLLCRIGIPIGLFVGGCVGYLLQPNGWNWINAAIWGITISLVIAFVVKLSMNKPIKIASHVAPIQSSKYMGSFCDFHSTKKQKRKLTVWGMAIISAAAQRKRVLISVISLGLSGLLFTLAATYTASVDAEAIVKKDVYQYGQFIVDTDGEYAQRSTELKTVVEKIAALPNVNSVKQIVETDISWAGNHTTGEDHLSIITATDFSSIQPFMQNSTLNYQDMVEFNQILAVEGADGISEGDTVEFTFGDGIKRAYTVGGILDGDIYTSTAIYGGWFLLPKELIPENSGLFNAIIKLVVATDNEDLEGVEDSLKLLTDHADNLSLNTIQEAVSEKETTIKEVGISIIGVTLFLLLFSMITFASTIITNIATRKREYAMLQSIGMTRKQVEMMTLCESCLLAGGSLTITLISGFTLGRAMIQVLVNAGVFYLSYTFPFALFVLYCFAILLIIAAITFSAFHTMQKASLVERLRIVD